MTRVRTILATLACVAIGAVCAPQARAESPDAAATLAEANAKFNEALATKDKAAARALFAEAIARWRVLAEDHGIQNPKLYVNMGNANLLAGDTGRAIANFRRAERANASDPAVQAGLEAARKQANGGTASPVTPTLSERVLQWAGYLPRKAMLVGFAIIWIAGWSVLGLRIMGIGPHWSRAVGPALLGLGALVVLPVAATEVMDSRLAHAVIVAAKAPAYNGPSDSVYQPTFKEGLPAGVEVRMLEARGEWTKVRLGDGRETWVRAVNLERI